MPRGIGNFWGFGIFFPIDNGLYNIPFVTHTKTAESIEMPFGMMSGLGPRNSLLRGVDDPRRRRGNFWGKHVLDKPESPNNCELDWSMQQHTAAADA